MLLYLEGDYYRQGVKHGAMARQAIKKNVEAVKRLILSRGADLKVYGRCLELQYDTIVACAPQVDEEMRGIAYGSDVPFEDILKLNIPFYFFAERFVQECSVMVAFGDATLDHMTYIVKNRDMKTPFEQVILHRTFPGGLRVIEEDLAGCVNMAGNGINSHGLVMGTTGVWSPNIPPAMDLIGKMKSAINPHTILKECRSVEEALDFLKSNSPYKISRSNLVLADQNRAVALEVTEHQLEVFEAHDGLLVRTNHFLSPVLQKYNPTTEEYPSTYLRYNRATDYLSRRRGRIRFQEMLAIASDHHNGPTNCICRHGQDNTSRTLCASIMVSQDGGMWTSLGNPCEALVYATTSKE